MTHIVLYVIIYKYKIGEDRMPDINVLNEFEPRPYQLEVFKALEGIGQKRKKRALLRWCRRSGKDLTCWVYLVTQMIKKPANYFYLFPEYAQGRRALWEKVDARTGKKLLDMIPEQLIKRINNQDMIIELKNNSTVRIIGSDNIDSVIGSNPHGIVFSEWAYSDPYAWSKMSPVLAENGGWAVFNSTPNGRNHMYDMEKRIRKMSTWYFSEVQCLWPEKAHYYPTSPQEVIDDDRAAGVEEAMIEQEYGVSYTAGVKGAFYSDVISQAYKDKRIGSFPPKLRGLVETYWDLGSRDDTAIWFMQRSGSAYIFIDYFEANNQDIGYYAEVLKEKGYIYGDHHLPWDGASKTVGVRFSIDKILRYSLKELKLSDSVRVAARTGVQEGIQAVRSIMEQCYFHLENTEDGLTKLEAYHRKWDSKKQVYLKQPDHDWSSHAADAFRTFGYFNVLHHGMDKPGDNYNQNVRVIGDFDPLDDL